MRSIPAPGVVVMATAGGSPSIASATFSHLPDRPASLARASHQPVAAANTLAAAAGSGPAGSESLRSARDPRAPSARANTGTVVATTMRYNPQRSLSTFGELPPDHEMRDQPLWPSNSNSPSARGDSPRKSARPSLANTWLRLRRSQPDEAHKISTMSVICWRHAAMTASVLTLAAH